MIKILHLSDIHIDLEYTEGLNAECGEPLCCRPPNKPAPPGRPAGHWGDYKCDLPWATANNLFEHLSQHKDDFDWIYWTGDLPAHNVWNQTRTEQLEILKLLSTQIRLFLGNKMIYPTLGNHESVPVNRSVSAALMLRGGAVEMSIYQFYTVGLWNYNIWNTRSTKWSFVIQIS